MRKIKVFFVILFSTLFSIPRGLAAGFDPNAIFPAWGNGGRVIGVIGSNGGSLQTGSGKLILYYMPLIINTLITVSAAVVFVMLIMAGLYFVWGEEEEVKKAKKFFVYGIIGILFIVGSYSLMKAVYYMIA